MTATTPSRSGRFRPLLFLASSLVLLGVSTGLSVAQTRTRVGVPTELLGAKAVNPLQEGPLYTYFDAVQFALKDAQALAVQEQQLRAKALAEHSKYFGPRASSVRYLWTGTYPRSQREGVAQAIAWSTNSFSREKAIKNWKALIVPGTDNTLLRVYLEDYAWDAKTWDNLGINGSGPKDRRFPEPYFHVITPVTGDTTGQNEVGQDGQPVKKVVLKDGKLVEEKVVVGKSVTQPADNSITAGGKAEVAHQKFIITPAPWIALERGKEKGEPEPGSTFATLATLTETDFPIYRADWFMVFGWWAPQYYNWFGLKSQEQGGKEADFQNLFFLDAKVVEKARSDVKGVVVTSRVSHGPRGLLRLPTTITPFGSYYWESLDSKKGIKGNNPIKDLLRAKIDAKEIIATLFNNLQGYAVANAAGELQDSADDEVASDFRTPLKQKRIYTGRNCAFCHDKGMWEIDDRVRKLSQKDIGLLVPEMNAEDAKRIEGLFFLYDLKPLTTHDGGTYEAAVWAATNMKSEDLIVIAERMTYNYLERGIGIQQVALEVGLPAEKILEYIKGGVGLDENLTGLIQTPPIEDIRRDQWEAESFPSLMNLLLARRAWDRP